MERICSECGAPLGSVERCVDYLNTMIAWDFEDFKGVGQIHHLTVLSYNVQHPSQYSQKGLENAIESLFEYTAKPTAFALHGARDVEKLSSNIRDWKIIATPDDQASYKQTPQWSMRASDVVSGGIDRYVENVEKWSNSIIEALKDSGEFQ